MKESVVVQFLLPLFSLLSEEFSSVICFKLSNLIPKALLPEAGRGTEESRVMPGNSHLLSSVPGVIFLLPKRQVLRLSVPWDVVVPPSKPSSLSPGRTFPRSPLPRSPSDYHRYRCARSRPWRWRTGHQQTSGIWRDRGRSMCIFWGGSERSGKMGLTANASYPIPTPFPGIYSPSSTK